MTLPADTTVLDTHGRGVSLAALESAATSARRVVCGYVNASGAVIGGTGFTASRDSTGVFTLTFTVPFVGTPAVLVTPVLAGGDVRWALGDAYAAGAQVLTFTAAGVPANRMFGFAAVSTD